MTPQSSIARKRRTAGLAAAAAAGAVALTAAVPARAQDGPFAAAFVAAQAHSAEFRGARHELEAREQMAPLALAALLPNVGASYSDSRVRGERALPNSLGQDFTQELDYRSPARTLQLRAPLMNLPAWLGLRAAQHQVASARSTFTVRRYELLERLGIAYLQRLFAEEALLLAQAQLDAYESQRDGAERRLGEGEGTRTEVADAAASVALARAQLIETRDQRALAQRALIRITGIEAPAWRGLSDDIAILPLPYDKLQEWIEAASRTSPVVAARRQLLDAARAETERSRAAHLPRIDLVVSAVDARNDSMTTLNQRSRLVSTGVQVTIPLYAGGGVEAGVVQATAEQARTQAQLDSDLEQLALDVQNQFQSIESGRLKVVALREAMLASALALEGTRRALEAGLRTTADVLEAVRKLFAAKRDLAQARFVALAARMRLLSLAGVPTHEIAADIDRHLTGSIAGTVVAKAQP